MSWWAAIALAVVSIGPATVPPIEPPATSVPPTTGSGVPATNLPAVDPNDPLGCNAVVVDAVGELDTTAVAETATRIAAALGADLHVRAEGSLDAGLAARMAQLEAQCPTWTAAGGGRAPDLVVVMYSSAEREAAVFYGAQQAAALEFRWEYAVDTMGPRFADGAFTDGVIDGLDALRRDPPERYSPPPFDATAYDDQIDDEPPGPGVPPIIWLGLIVLVVVAVVRVATFVTNGEWEPTDSSDDDDSGSSWSWSSSASSSHSRSWSSGRSSSRSSSRPSSSGRRSSGRAGGGAKKW